MNESEHAKLARRLEIASNALKELSGQSNWYVDSHWAVEECEIPKVARLLRLYGGHRGYRITAELEAK